MIPVLICLRDSLSKLWPVLKKVGRFREELDSDHASTVTASRDRFMMFWDGSSIRQRMRTPYEVSVCRRFFSYFDRRVNTTDPSNSPKMESFLENAVSMRMLRPQSEPAISAISRQKHVSIVASSSCTCVDLHMPVTRCSRLSGPPEGFRYRPALRKQGLFPGKQQREWQLPAHQ